MKFHQYDKKRPKEGQFCLIKEVLDNGQIHLELFPQMYSKDFPNGFLCHPRVIAWAPLPEHICIDPKGWKSEYRGDDLPSKSGFCLVCTDKKRTVSRAYFDAKAQRFLGNPDVVAYMPI